jgi:hypothetical protein
MTLSINHEDASDLELQREIQEACGVFLSAAGHERSIAKGHYLKLLRAFSARVLECEPRISDWLTPCTGPAVRNSLPR